MLVLAAVVAVGLASAVAVAWESVLVSLLAAEAVAVASLSVVVGESAATSVTPEPSAQRSPLDSSVRSPLALPAEVCRRIGELLWLLVGQRLSPAPGLSQQQPVVRSGLAQAAACLTLRQRSRLPASSQSTASAMSCV